MLAFLVAAQTFVADRFDKKSDRGASAVEYGILVAVLAGFVLAAILVFGPWLVTLFTGAGDAVDAAIP